MPCIIKSDDTTIVFKKGTNGAPGYWLVGGRHKVADLSECKFIPSEQDRKLVVPTQETAAAASSESAEIADANSAQPPRETYRAGATVEMTDMPEVQSIMSLAGDSVWGGIVILALVMIFKFMNKKLEMENKSQSELSQQCSTRHTDVASKFENVSKQVADLDKRMSSLELELRYSLDPRDRDRDRDRGDTRRSSASHPQHPSGPQR
jgi:hypothetical protein